MSTTSASGSKATSAAAPATTTSSRPCRPAPRRCGGKDMAEQGIGAAVRRTEDFRFLTGRGHYTDDINRPNQTHAYFLRSPHAHAKIRQTDTDAARRGTGVAAVF